VEYGLGLLLLSIAFHEATTLQEANDTLEWVVIISIHISCTLRIRSGVCIGVGNVRLSKERECSLLDLVWVVQLLGIRNIATLLLIHIGRYSCSQSTSILLKIRVHT
jgi:hypothetical protein